MIQKKWPHVVNLTVIAGFCWLLAGNSATAASATYQDVADNYPYQSYIQELSAKHLIDGIAEGQFAPDSPLSREQFAKLVVTAFTLPAKDGSLPFLDCSSAWSIPYIRSAYEAGIIQGTSEDHFSLELYVRKQDAAIMIARLFPDSQGADAWTFVRSSILPVTLQSLLDDPGAPLSRGEAAALISLAMHAQDQGGLGGSANHPALLPYPGEVKAPHEDAWFELQLQPKQLVQLHVDSGRLLEIQDPDHHALPAAAGGTTTFTAKQGGRYLVHAAGLRSGSVLTAADGTSRSHALLLDPADPQGLTVDIQPGDSLFVQGQLKPHTAYFLEAKSEQQSLFDMSLSDTEGAFQRQGFVSVLQSQTGADGALYGTISPGKQGGAVTLHVLEAGLDVQHPILLQAGRFQQLFPKEGELYYKLPDGAGNSLMIQALGAKSYKWIQWDTEIPPMKYDDKYHVPPKPDPNSVKAETTSLHDQPFFLPCSCRILIAAPANSEVSFNVMDGASMGTAYPVEWSGRSWETGYRSNSKSGNFYQIALEQGRRYKFSVNERTADSNQTNPLSSYLYSISKMTIYGPDGKVVLQNDKLTEDTVFTPLQTGTYTVELQLDVPDRSTEIKVVYTF